MSLVVDKLVNHDVVNDVGDQPEEHKVGSKYFIVPFDLGLVFLVGCECLSSSGGWSVTPRDVMQVAHGIYLEYVGEHWQE